jgi:EAL domain-containing protein (putative c-di-GMP-specific phosphodiesterase class I)
MTGAEALLLWRHPDLGLLAPAIFIPLAEETGLILPMGLWVLETACKQNKAWQDMGFPSFKMAVNLSGRQFKQLNLTDIIRQTLNKAGLNPTCLDLEITESILMENAPSTRKILQELKLMGVQISIDDFGTGYSSLSYLKHFPIDRLKIDRSFVHDVNYDTDDAAIAESIIALGHSLRIKVLAEGVETKEQLNFLQELHCDEMQGYYFSRPLSLEDFTELLNSGLGANDVCLFHGGK